MWLFTQMAQSVCVWLCLRRDWQIITWPVCQINRRYSYVGPMLGERLWRWSNIGPTKGQILCLLGFQVNSLSQYVLPRPHQFDTWYIRTRALKYPCSQVYAFYFQNIFRLDYSRLPQEEIFRLRSLTSWTRHTTTMKISAVIHSGFQSKVGRHRCQWFKLTLMVYCPCPFV